MKQFFPHTVLQDEQLVTRMQVPEGAPWAAGVFNDIPASAIPKNGLAASNGYRCFKETLEPAAGCRVWSATVLPGLPGRTGYAYSKWDLHETDTNVIIKSVGTDFTEADIGNFFIHDDGLAEQIIDYIDADTIQVENSDAHGHIVEEHSIHEVARGTAGWLRGPVNGTEKHQTKKKIITHIDTRIFISDPEVSAYTEAYCISKTGLSNVKSRIYEQGDYAIIVCNGILFRLDLTGSIYLFWQINDPAPSQFVTEVARTTTKTYGYKYVYTMTRISGASDTRDRTTADVVIQHETAPLPRNSAGLDYSTVYSDRPAGDESTTYGVLTGATLVTPYDAPSGWSSITNGQFIILLNSVNYTVAVDFTGVLTMADVADRIQAGLRVFSAAITCVYTVDHFVITMPTEGDTIGNTSAGPSGTDIGSTVMKCQTDVGSVTNPTYSKKIIVGIMKVPVDGSSNRQLHHTHYSRYRTLDFGIAGINPVNGEGNNEEQFVWESDIPIAKAFVISAIYDWALRDVAAANEWQSIAYGNGCVIAVANTGTGNRIMRSTNNGKSWSEIESPGDYDWRSVCYGNNLFVAVSYDGYVMASVDGLVWTLRTAESHAWSCVCYGNGKYVAVSSTNFQNYILLSTDGITWVASLAGVDSFETKSIVWGAEAGVFVVVGTTRGYTNKRIMSSPDGLVWTLRGPDGGDLYGVSYKANLFVAVGEDYTTGWDSVIRYSADGITWTTATGIAIARRWRSVAYGDGKFVAVAYPTAANFYRPAVTTNLAAWSTDGETWTAYTTPATNSWKAVCHGDGVFIAASIAGTTPVVSTPHAMTMGTCIAFSAGNLQLCDEGSILQDSAGTEATITEYVTATTAVISGTLALGRAAIGGDATVAAIRIITASQAGQVVTSSAGSAFTEADIGKTIFWAGGVRSHIIEFLTSSTVTVAESATIASTAACMDPVCRYSTDSTDDEVLRGRITTFSLMHRFWVPFPSVDLFIMVPGFVFCALRDGTYYYYGEVGLDEEYLIGAHNDRYQLDRTNDPIRAIREFPDYVVLYCANSRLKIPINTWLTKDINGIVSCSVLSGRYLQQDQIGLNDYTAIARLPDGTDYLVTGEPAVRIYDGTKFSTNLAKDRYMNNIELFQDGLSILYDPFNGISIYGPITIGINHAEKCVRHGIKADEHGVGFYDMPVDDMPLPETRVGVLSIADSNSILRGLVLDYHTSKWYDVTTRHGPAGSGMSICWKGISEEKVQRSIKLIEDRGSFEHQQLRNLLSHLYCRPYDELNRNQAGYDAAGYPDELEIDLKFYVDGEPTTATTTVKNIAKTGGDLKTDRRVEGARIQLEVVSNTGDHIITQRQQYYAQKNDAAAPDLCVSKEMDWQDELSNTVYWISVLSLE